MNFALVSHFKVSADTSEAILEWLRTALRSQQSSNLAEVVFYRAANPQQFLNLSFFWQEASTQECKDLFRLSSSSQGLDTRQLVKQQLYRLLWEYRSFGHYYIASASALQILNFVGSHSCPELRTDLTLASQQLRADTPELVGLWLGEALYSEKPYFIIRSDWKSLQGYHDFISSQRHQRFQMAKQVLKAEAVYSTELEPLSWSLDKDDGCEWLFI